MHGAKVKIWINSLLGEGKLVTTHLHEIFLLYLWLWGTYSSAFGWGTALQVRRSWVQFPMVSLEFFIDIILPAALWPWG